MANAALGSKAVGSIVKLKVGGAAKNFIVVHQGRPSSVYDTSCDGTWLLMEDCYESKEWHRSKVNDYANSTIHSYLNSTFLNLFDANIKSYIKQVKLPYRAGLGYGKTVTSGSSGLSAKIFLLSSTEVNLVHGYEPTNEGATLSYFSGCATNGADSKRIAKLNGSAVLWWLRSPYCRHDGGGEDALGVGGNGNWDLSGCSYPYGVRPALILPSTLLVSDDGTVTTNTSPTTPASVTIPSTIMGGSTITVKWGTSTDAEKNLAGYKVERSVTGGSSWTQIYQGTATQTTDKVPFGTETVMYRVRAYDSEGLHSGYRNSTQVTVINNTAPTSPAGITVPAEVLGGAGLTVSWGAAGDAEGNLAGYSLERQVNGGEWAQIYKGQNVSYTDTITRGWSRVAYRVRAYDIYDAYSAYTTSETRTVNNNRAPTITCDTESGADLGTRNEGFSIAYSVNDEDGDAVTVTEAIDGVTLRTFSAALGESCTFEVSGGTFQKLLNGAHVLTVSAGDGKAVTVYKLTFTKEVTEASVTLTEPFAADDKISICVLSVRGYIPQDADYAVEVSNNAKDDVPVWEDCTMEVRNGGNHVFANETADKGFAFNFRVTVERGPSGEGGYINSIQGGFQ